MEEGMRTISTSTEARQAAIRQQLQGVDIMNKDQDTAFLIELIGGIFGFLGVGYIYSGLTNAGLLRLIGMWVFLFVSWSIIGMLSVILIGLCLIPVPFIVQIALAYFSAQDLKKSMIAAKADAQAASAGASSFGGYLNQESSSMPNMPMGQQEREDEL